VRPLQWLGHLSFPLYLVHIPILCSLGCRIFLWAPFGKDYARMDAIIATAAMSFFAAWLLAYPNDAWLSFLNRATHRIWPVHNQAERLPAPEQSVFLTLLSGLPAWRRHRP
jgi:peptidoglycan/LPS O-acetylase OafA/YrhL